MKEIIIRDTEKLDSIRLTVDYPLSIDSLSIPIKQMLIDRHIHTKVEYLIGSSQRQ